MQIAKINRVKVQGPRGDKAYWCGSCDVMLVHDGQKCPVCGHVADGRKTMRPNRTNARGYYMLFEGGADA